MSKIKNTTLSTILIKSTKTNVIYKFYNFNSTHKSVDKIIKY